MCLGSVSCVWEGYGVSVLLAHDMMDPLRIGYWARLDYLRSLTRSNT